MSDELKDKVFCEIASELGFITQEQTEKVLDAQKVEEAIGQKKRIASYLLDMNLISKDQISQVIKMQDKIESSQAKPVEQIQPNQQQNNLNTTCTQINKTQWSSLTSFVSGIIILLMAMTEPEGQWSNDAIAGGIFFGFIPIFFGIISLSQGHNRRWMAISGLVLGSVVVLASLGSM